MNIGSVLSVMLFLFLIVCRPVCANSQKIIEKYDIGSYHPENYGLKDLVFQVRLSNLLDHLNEKKIYGKLKDVYFKTYWLFPGKYKVEVIGMPRGFKRMKYNLRNMIYTNLDFVIPKKFSSEIEGYQFEIEKKGLEISMRGKDKSRTKDISEMYIVFDKKSKLKRIKTYSPAGENDSRMEMSVKSWSHNKWALEKITSKIRHGMQTTVMEKNVVYTTVAGFGFPERVNIETTQTSNHSKSTKEKIDLRKTVTSIIFSNYKVNMGEARKYMDRDKKQKK